jgi:hypothetical protein
MGKVIARASMSLDGFIAEADDQAGQLYGSHDNGDVEVTGAGPGLAFHISLRPKAVRCAGPCAQTPARP